MSKAKQRLNEPQPERRIVELDYEEITEVIHFGIFVVQPDGTKLRVLGGGELERQDLDRVVEELGQLATEFAVAAASNVGGRG